MWPITSQPPRGKRCYNGSFVPAGKVLYRADENAVRDHFGQTVAVLGAVVHVGPVAVLEDDGLPGDAVQAALQQLHVLQEPSSADQAIVGDAEPGHSVHQEVGPLIVVQAQQHLRFEESVVSQQRLRTRNK